MSINSVQREAITFAKCWLHYGQRGLDQALNILAGAAEQMLGQAHCHECGGPVTTPIYDAEALALLGSHAPAFCSMACREVVDERRINAAGGAS